MRAVLVTQPGGPEVLVWQEVPDPEPAAGEVLIEVAASAVNRADLLQRQGHYAPPPGAPPYPGLECSGVIAASRRGRRGLARSATRCAPCCPAAATPSRWPCRPGRCCRCPTASTWSPPRRCPRWPARSGRTSSCWPACAPARRCWCTAAASGIGTMAIQLATAIGARVAVTAGSADKLERCRRARRARSCVNYRDEDFVEAVRAATDGHGADVILDNMGAKYLARNLEVLATNGRLVIIGLQGGTRAELDLGLLMRKRGAVLSTSRCGPGRRRRRRPIVASVREHVWPLVVEGRVRPVVDRVLPMAAGRRGAPSRRGEQPRRQGAAGDARDLTAGLPARCITAAPVPSLQTAAGAGPPRGESDVQRPSDRLVAAAARTGGLAAARRRRSRDGGTCRARLRRCGSRQGVVGRRVAALAARGLAPPSCCSSTSTRRACAMPSWRW